MTAGVLAVAGPALGCLAGEPERWLRLTGLVSVARAPRYGLFGMAIQSTVITDVPGGPTSASLIVKPVGVSPVTQITGKSNMTPAWPGLGSRVNDTEYTGLERAGNVTLTVPPALVVALPAR
jgi:hypothetical protein